MNPVFAPSKKSSTSLASHVVAFSISFEPEHMLARGMGLEHLRDLLVRLARPLLRMLCINPLVSCLHVSAEPATI